MTVSGLFTSESVTEGHPDKVADQISDAILDAVLAEDPAGRVACETLVTRDLIVIAGEITASGSVDHERMARQTVRRIGYTDPALGFHDGCEVQVRLVAQSADIARGVDWALEVRGQEARTEPGRRRLRPLRPAHGGVLPCHRPGPRG